MEFPINEDLQPYINDAIIAFEQIVVGDQYSVLEKMMRIKKGENFVLKVLLRRKNFSYIKIS